MSIIVHTPKETNEEIKIKRNTFSLVADVDVEESVFFNAELKLLFYWTALERGSFSQNTSKISTCVVLIRNITNFSNQIFL